MEDRKFLEENEKTKVKRAPQRASYDRNLFNQIIDDAKIGHLAFLDKEKNVVESIPMLFWRNEDFIYFHCSVESRLEKLSKNQDEICVSFTIIDGLVLAKSAFNHSMNYHSAIAYGRCSLVENTSKEKLIAFQKLMELYDSGRWQQVRKPNSQEMKVTSLLKLPIKEAVVKIHRGPPNDTEEDKKLNVWAGVIPVNHVYGEPKEYDYLTSTYKENRKYPESKYNFSNLTAFKLGIMAGILLTMTFKSISDKTNISSNLMIYSTLFLLLLASTMGKKNISFFTPKNNIAIAESSSSQPNLVQSKISFKN